MLFLMLINKRLDKINSLKNYFYQRNDYKYHEYVL